MFKASPKPESRNSRLHVPVPAEGLAKFLLLSSASWELRGMSALLNTEKLPASQHLSIHPHGHNSLCWLRDLTLDRGAWCAL